MPEHFHKFLFLGAVMLTTIFFGRQDLAHTVVGEVNRGRSPAQAIQVPILALSSPPTPLRITSSFQGGDYINSPKPPPLTSPRGEPDEPKMVMLQDSSRVVPEPFYQIERPADPRLLAQSGLVADLKTGEEYFVLNPERHWPIASITKLMSAVVAKEVINHPESVSAVVPNRGKYSAQDLTLLMLLISHNDAAEALAGVYGREDFILGMNRKAKEWELLSTYFSDPTGISNTNQSTVRDLRLLAERVYEGFPEILAVTRERSAKVTELESGRSEIIVSNNSFAGRVNFIGGKTGYTDESSGNLLTLLMHEGRPVVIVVLGSSDRFGETEKLISWFQDAYRSNY